VEIDDDLQGSRLDNGNNENKRKPFWQPKDNNNAPPPKRNPSQTQTLDQDPNLQTQKKEKKI
jgi:hypothetical protein